MHDLERTYMTRTTHKTNHSQHRLDKLVEFGVRQTEVRRDQRYLGGAFVRGEDRFVGGRHRQGAHATLGYGPGEIAKKLSEGLLFFATLVICLGLPLKTASAGDPINITPTRLDFDAKGLPANCNDLPAFKAILTDWVPQSSFSVDAPRKLLVHIRRSSKGGKVADVTLVGEDGAQIGAHHATFSSKTECHKVLWDVARAAAQLLGAFEKPPEPEPPLCPACPLCAACSTCPACPIPEAPRKTAQTAQVAIAPTRRAFFGAGMFIGTGFTQDTFVGPQFSLGFVPSRYAPSIHVEMNGAWTQQTIFKLNVDIVPLFGSICYSRSVFRMCSGLTTTFFQAKSAELVPGTDESRTTLGGHLRMGAEFSIAGPFSIRVDAFAMLRFWQRSYGSELATLDTRGPFGAGAAVMGVWSWE
jgi:hypothetical protein